MSSLPGTADHSALTASSGERMFRSDRLAALEVRGGHTSGHNTSKTASGD
jgi:hypothetical protein